MITGKEYPIDTPTGEAIVKIFFDPIELQQLNKAKQVKLALYNNASIGLGYWLIYFRTGLISPSTPPFQLPEIQDIKPQAEVFSRMLDLCRGVLESSQAIEKDYSSPYFFWEACLKEWRQWGIDGILSEKKILKGTKEDKTREFYNALKKSREVLLPAIPETKHNRRLFKAACQLADPFKGNLSFRQQFWFPYLSSLNKSVKAIKHNKKVKAVFEENGLLKYQKGNASLLFPDSQ